MTEAEIEHENKISFGIELMNVLTYVTPFFLILRCIRLIMSYEYWHIQLLARWETPIECMQFFTKSLLNNIRVHYVAPLVLVNIL